ncbi:DUF2029 domain-containing protein [Rhodococcus sp. D2-41]|uniref:glycosyltransferase family 87 protein n=1 Tax=Speluncibacter jeojiensis TaxID=2710754 RepID=UPI0024107D11|nr:glycosyltransferase family 87 protein [Rhodococcus sp. D2-41]MDG3011372.1 DUF2029 domain-containing protein [Rhodococcus sp. D2-41]
MFLQRFVPRHARTTSEVIKAVFWPIAIMTVIHRMAVLAVNGARTNDFAPVWDAARKFLHHQAIYTDNFNSVDPHYLYYPSGTLLMAPAGLINYEWSRWGLIIVDAAAIIVAGYVLLKMFGYGLNSLAAPVLLFAMFSTETVSNTLIFTNINGVILLGEMLFLWLLLKGHQTWAGVPMGLTIAIKPTLAPIMLLPLLNRQWRPFVAAIGIPVVLTAIAWPLSADPMQFVHHTLPNLFQARDYFNSSIVGNGLYYGLPSWLILALRILFAALVLASLWLLYRYYRHDQLFFLCTGSGLLLAASFLLLSLGQQYYSMMLFPLMMTVVLKNSVIRNWPAWLAAYGFLSFDSWLSGRFRVYGEAATYLRPTLGWSLLIVVIFTVLLNRYLVARAENRLDRGIDPQWCAPAPHGRSLGAADRVTVGA